MSDAMRDSLAERVTSLEAQLRRAQECIDSFEASRQRLARGFAIAIASVLGVAIAVSQTVAVKGGPTATATYQSMTVEAPLRVVDSSGHRIFSVFDNNGQGGAATFYTTAGKDVAEIGVSKQGGGGVGVNDPDLKQEAEMWGQNAGAWFDVKKDGNLAAVFGVGVLTGNEKTAALALTSATGSALAQLQVVNGNGNLQLMDSKEDIRVEAGTEENGDGAVKVSGPEGKCYPGLAGLPCIIIAH